MPETTGTPTSCLSAGRRLRQLTPVTSFLRVLSRCQFSPPFPQDSLDCAAAALASREGRILGKSPRNGCIPVLHKAWLSLPTAARTGFVPLKHLDAQHKARPLERQHRALLQHRLKCLIAKVQRSSREGCSAGMRESERVPPPRSRRNPEGPGSRKGGDGTGVAFPCGDSAPSAV